MTCGNAISAGHWCLRASVSGGSSGHQWQRADADRMSFAIAIWTIGPRILLGQPLVLARPWSARELGRVGCRIGDGGTAQRSLRYASWRWSGSDGEEPVHGGVRGDAGVGAHSKSWTVTSSGGGKRWSTQVTNSAVATGEPYLSESSLPESSRATWRPRPSAGSGRSR